MNNASIDRFHNPYNFIPAPPRNEITSEAGDREPLGHHRLVSGTYSGRIRVRMTAVTPLLVLDAARAERNQEDHAFFPVRIGPDKRPLIAPTSVKGMLRSAFEAVTNSRLGVFVGHDRPLGFRLPARRTPKAAIVEEREGRLVLRFLRPARIRFYDTRSQSRDRGKEGAVLRYSRNAGGIPKHGDHVWARVSNNTVTDIVPFDKGKPSNEYREGWVLEMGPNIKDKRYERVFYIFDGNNKTVHVDERIEALWRDLILNYQEIHVKDLEQRRAKGQKPWDYLGDEPGRTAWSRQVWQKGYEELRAGTLCYVDMVGNSVRALYPVAISRELYKLAPRDLVHPSLLPATEIDQLSPADRVFGWVKQNGNGAYRGQLRISPVRCLSENAIASFGAEGLPLAILGEPKPQQTRFYAADDKQGTPLPNGADKQRGYNENNRSIRGRKVYPHHQGLPPDHWENPLEDRTQIAREGHYQEYRRPKLNNQEQRDNQNRSVKGWVKPGSVFEFDIHFWNLSAFEAGALLWLLSLPQNWYHRFGGGKPLGFGSVRLTLEPGASRVCPSEEWANSWKELADVPADASSTRQQIPELIRTFKQTLAEAYGNEFEELPFIQAFHVACRGFHDGLPVHYPRTGDPGGGRRPPDPEGKNYEWFVENERSGNRRSLPDIRADEGLPCYPPRREREAPKSGSRGKGSRKKKKRRGR